MNRLGQSRAAAMTAAVITGLAVVYGLALLLGLPDPSWAYLPRGVIHLGETAAVVALALSGAAGNGWLARSGLVAAGLGTLMLAAAEVISGSDTGISDPLFYIAPNLVGLGLIGAGIAVVRAGLWSGWRKYVPLTLGLYVFLVMTPAIIASGGPPAVPALLAITGWDVLWTLVAAAVLAATARDESTAVVS